MVKKKGIVKKIIDIFLTVLLICSVILVILGVYSKITGKSVFSFRVLWVLTDSMENTIPENSYIIIKKVDASDIKEGDVITFVSQDPEIKGNLNTHRVVEIIGNNEEFVTKGDNCIAEDSTHVKKEDVVGIYVMNLNVLSAIGRAYATPYGLIFTIVLILLGTVIWFICFTKKNKKEEFEKRVKEEVEKLEREYNEKQK